MLLLTFTAGSNRHAVDAARVVELVPRVALRAVPHAPEHLAGLLSSRGPVVPVIDLRLLLGAGPCRDRLATRIILVDAARDLDHPAKVGMAVAAERQDSAPKRRIVGLIAEEVSDLLSIRPEQAVPSPVILSRAPYLGPIVQTERGEIVQILLVDALESAALDSSEEHEPAALIKEPRA